MTPLQLGTQEYVNTQINLLAIVASQPFYKALVLWGFFGQFYFCFSSAFQKQRILHVPGTTF